LFQVVYLLPETEIEEGIPTWASLAGRDFPVIWGRKVVPMADKIRPTHQPGGIASTLRNSYLAQRRHFVEAGFPAECAGHGVPYSLVWNWQNPEVIPSCSTRHLRALKSKFNATFKPAFNSSDAVRFE
jgi:hypothetical protein